MRGKKKKKDPCHISRSVSQNCCLNWGEFSLCLQNAPVGLKTVLADHMCDATGRFVHLKVDENTFLPSSIFLLKTSFEGNTELCFLLQRRGKVGKRGN